MRHTLHRSGVSTGDVMILLAFVAVIAALVAPTVRGRRFEARVEGTTAEVDALRDAAVRHLDASGAWPTGSLPGVVPDELAAVYSDGDLAGDQYTLQWTRWEVVDSTVGPPIELTTGSFDAPPDSVRPPMLPVVRTVGAIVLHSRDDALIAELLSRYGEGSFVRDTTWTLLLPRRAGG